MTPVEFRAVREGLGVTTTWLAERWDIAPRTVERWEAGVATIADFAADDLAVLEVTAGEHVARHVADLSERERPVLAIDEGPDAWPPRWQRAIAFRVRQQLPGLKIVKAAPSPE